MARGRKRKKGKRTPSGQLSRAGKPRDRGSAAAEAKASLYGTDGTDALGRAYRFNLISLEARDTGRALGRAYWPIFGVGKMSCTLAGQSSGGHIEDEEQALRNEQWLNERLATVNALGSDVRKAFDELVIDINPDCGPAWLDRLIHAKRMDRDCSNRDLVKLAQAMTGLEILIDRLDRAA
ncbi:hypothetical protein [Sphingorhabdus sp. SMR4y]|uniref:hypothetical protein n=1 Tax=Sphingorhabdus sp. SMR4y TaxID=2584094 RepID=UPI000B5C22CF|nr:hypothetical protein [Sphingorhabdus sp. SMR4y]ASK88473.1 hypothetical protein SPHFLASMR4Y_01726 [Sphingorhabdus sp. SMR4y]